MTNCFITIEHNPGTGSKRPWEVYFNNTRKDGSKVKQICGSCATEENAIKCGKAAAKRNTFGNRICEFRGR